MRFSVAAVPTQDFEKWVAATRSDGQVLDARAYSDLAEPSTAVAPFTYRTVAPDLFDSILGAVVHPIDQLQHTTHQSERAER